MEELTCVLEMSGYITELFRYSEDFITLKRCVETDVSFDVPDGSFEVLIVSDWIYKIT